MRPNQFTVVCVTDEAIDTESMTNAQIMEYAKTRDINLLSGHFLPNKQPTKYHVRAVPHSLWESYVCGAGEHDEIRFRRSFMCGVESVTNLLGDDGIGVSWKPTRVVQGTALTVMSDEECNERFSPAEVNEIGSVIYKHSFLSRRTKLTYQLPLSLFGPLVDRSFRPAEQSQSTASTSTNSTHSESKASLPTMGTENLAE